MEPTTQERVLSVLKTMGFEVTPEQPLKGVLDSLDRVEFVMRLEQEFNVLITDAQTAQIATVEDVVTLLAPWTSK